MFEFKDIKLYLKPSNDFLYASGAYFIIPTPIINHRTKITENYRKSTYLHKNVDYPVINIEGDYFYIEIIIETDKEGFLFNPREVYLELEDGKYLQASKYIKPDGNLEPPSWHSHDVFSLYR